MKISVITVCYNAAAVIEGCLRSVAAQTYRDIEHIVIDGLSSDATVAVVRRYPHVARLVSEADRGIYDAMNKGLDLASGDYVLFLNADDTFAAATAATDTVAAIRRDPGADVYYGLLEVRPSGGPTYVFRPPPPAEAPVLMICGCLPHQSTLARPSVFARTGRFDLRYRYHADYDWFLKILADPEIDVRMIDTIVGSFLLGGASSQLAAGQPEVYRIQNQSPLYASAEWDRKRIEVLQEAFLRERLETARLRDELASERARGPRLGDAAVAGRTAIRWVRNTVRSRSRGLRWWILANCVRYLPHSVVEVLRRLRAQGPARWLSGRIPR